MVQALRDELAAAADRATQFEATLMQTIASFHTDSWNAAQLRHESVLELMAANHKDATQASQTRHEHLLELLKLRFRRPAT
jgi:hypothetical protein